jgi:hypothetical protein
MAWFFSSHTLMHISCCVCTCKGAIPRVPYRASLHLSEIHHGRAFEMKSNQGLPLKDAQDGLVLLEVSDQYQLQVGVKHWGTSDVTSQLGPPTHQKSCKKARRFKMSRGLDSISILHITASAIRVLTCLCGVGMPPRIP